MTEPYIDRQRSDVQRLLIHTAEDFFARKPSLSCSSLSPILLDCGGHSLSHQGCKSSQSTHPSRDFFMTYFPPSLLGRPHYSFSCCFRVRPICKLYITPIAFCCLYAKVYIRIVYGHARCFALISSLRSVWNSNHFQPAATAKVGRLLIARIPPQCNDPAKCTKIFYQTCN